MVPLYGTLWYPSVFKQAEIYILNKRKRCAEVSAIQKIDLHLHTIGSGKTVRDKESWNQLRTQVCVVMETSSSVGPVTQCWEYVTIQNVMGLNPSHKVGLLVWVNWLYQATHTNSVYVYGIVLCHVCGTCQARSQTFLKGGSKTSAN